MKNRKTVNHRGVSTPWGAADTAREYGPGLVFYGTPSHGGFSVSAERWAVLLARLGPVKPWAGRGWLEEDCDWALAALAFPECFSDSEIYGAFETLAIGSTNKGAASRAMMDADLVKRASGWWEANRDTFRTGCMGSSNVPGFDWQGSASTVDGSIRVGFASVKYPQIPEGTRLDGLEACGLRVLTRHEEAARPCVLDSIPLPLPVRAERLAVAFREEDCGGVFDGVSVTSDADPGL